MILAFTLGWSNLSTSAKTPAGSAWRISDLFVPLKVQNLFLHLGREHRSMIHLHVWNIIVDVRKMSNYGIGTMRKCHSIRHCHRPIVRVSILKPLEEKKAMSIYVAFSLMNGLEYFSLTK